MAVRDELERVDARELFPIKWNEAPREVANRRRDGTRLGGGVRSGGRGKDAKGQATTLGRGVKVRAGVVVGGAQPGAGRPRRLFFLWRGVEQITLTKLVRRLRARGVGGFALRGEFGGTFVDPADLEVFLDRSGDCGVFLRLLRFFGKEATRG